MTGFGAVFFDVAFVFYVAYCIPDCQYALVYIAFDYVKHYG